MQRRALPEAIGSFCLHGPGGLLLALKSGIHTYDCDRESLTRVLQPEPTLPTNRLNDGKCDRQGRFWVGSMNDGDRIPSGTLYVIDRGWECRPTLRGLMIPNSLAWSPDGKRMYFSDTQTFRIFAYDYDVENGALLNPQVFADLSGHQGRPDGSTVDADGCLWNAEANGSRVVRYTPDGRVDKTIALPVSSVTSCAFGGADLATLYITSARQRLSEAQLADQPLAGALFAAHVGTVGIPETPFRG